MEETEIKRKSFYEWIGTILKVKAMYIEFWLSVFPAIFIDIVAPIAIALSMFLRKYSKETIEKMKKSKSDKKLSMTKKKKRKE